LQEPSTRVYLTGEVIVERGPELLRERDLPSRQARIALVHLALERERPIAHEELAWSLWQEEPPAAWQASLSALISRLRQVLGGIGLDRSAVISSAFGCYQLRLENAWIDVEAARMALHLAESAVGRGDPMSGYGDALIANIILRRGFLHGESGSWVERRRSVLLAERLRALDCMAQCLAANGEWTLAIRRAEESVELEPYRETGYATLMDLHHRSGNRAEALRTYERCRGLLRDELGVSPSAEMESAHRTLLREQSRA
jgi:DNA-binding SARP family transcriptional activator